MAEHGFTPGKWEADDVRYQRNFCTFVNVMAPHGLVACVSSDPQHPETIAANARLIAASPTLLEALEGIAAINPAELQENDQLALIHAFLLARQKAIAAITLATGKDA